MEIIATFVPSPRRESASEIARPPAGATMVELRADLLPADADLAELVAASPLPVVLTLRSRAEGGKGADQAERRRKFFTAAAALPVALFDLEAARDVELVGRVIPAERVVLSAHFPAGVPVDLEESAARALSVGTRLVKIVPHAHGVADVVSVLRLARAFERSAPDLRRTVIFASGEAGRLTRVLGPLLGAPIAYAAWSREQTAAEGQFEPAALLALAGHLTGSPRRIFLVVGRDVGSSLSPLMHAAAYREVGLPSLFAPLEVTAAEELDSLVCPLGESCLDRLGLPLGGLAVTMPWKGEAARRCSVVAPRAQRAGAVNTVLPRPGKVLGDCTDIDGISRVLAELGVDLEGSRVLVLGAGGAARAAVVAMQLAGATPLIAARDGAKAAVVGRELGVEVVSPADAGEAVAVINATPAGLEGKSSLLLESIRLAGPGVAVDMPYGVAPTLLEELARSRGWNYVSGREVLLFQGVAQFAAMCGVAPPVRAMAAALGLRDDDV